ncbi:retrotransposon protein, putative, ty1-copia subclass, partial [Tanacetum coccineum]
AMLKIDEKGIPKKVVTPVVLLIIGAYAPKPKITPPPKKDHLAKNSIRHHYNEVGHLRRKCPAYLAELKKKNTSLATTSDDVFYSNVIPRDGIYEIDIHDLVLNVSSIYNVRNKRAKRNLDSTYLWHCHLRHINKKHIEKLQHDGLLKPIDDESFDKFKSCTSGKMACKPFSHQTERAKDLYLSKRMYVVPF